MKYVLKVEKNFYVTRVDWLQNNVPVFKYGSIEEAMAVDDEYLNGPIKWGNSEKTRQEMLMLKHPKLEVVRLNSEGREEEVVPDEEILQAMERQSVHRERHSQASPKSKDFETGPDVGRNQVEHAEDRVPRPVFAANTEAEQESTYDNHDEEPTPRPKPNFASLRADDGIDKRREVQATTENTEKPELHYAESGDANLETQRFQAFENERRLERERNYNRDREFYEREFPSHSEHQAQKEGGYPEQKTEESFRRPGFQQRTPLVPKDEASEGMSLSSTPREAESRTSPKTDKDNRRNLTDEAFGKITEEQSSIDKNEELAKPSKDRKKRQSFLSFSKRRTESAEKNEKQAEKNKEKVTEIKKPATFTHSRSDEEIVDSNLTKTHVEDIEEKKQPLFSSQSRAGESAPEEGYILIDKTREIAMYLDDWARGLDSRVRFIVSRETYENERLNIILRDPFLENMSRHELSRNFYAELERELREKFGIDTLRFNFNGTAFGFDL